MQFFYGFFHANALLKISMNVKTKAITAMKMQTVQTLMAPSIVAVILAFLEMEVHAQVSENEKGVRRNAGLKLMLSVKVC